MRKLCLILSVAGLAGPVATAAQNPGGARTMMGRPAEQNEECVTKDGKTECRIIRIEVRDSTRARRAALGVQVQTTGTKRDTLGVFIARVTPDGPAEKAGVVEGERISAINGVDLRVPVADVDDSYTAGLAAHRLSREVQKLAPGARVTLRVNSGGRSREVQVVAARASELKDTRFEMEMGFPGMPNIQILRREIEGGSPRMLRVPAPVKSGGKISGSM